MSSIVRDVPSELKEWVKIFQSLTYRHDYSRTFEDWLDITISCLAMKTREDVYLETIKRYDSKEQKLLADLFAEYLLLMQKMTAEKEHATNETKKVIAEMELAGIIEATTPNAVPWYDALGHIYEVISSHGKKQGLGQFFTPPHIVDLMVKCVNYNGGTLMEPCSGSGRMIIAAHCHYPSESIKIGCDLDGMCTKMTAINMCLHGVRGEAINCNSLDPLNFNFGFCTNPRLFTIGTFAVDKETSYYYKSQVLWAVNASEKEIEAKQINEEARLAQEKVDTTKLKKPTAKEIKQEATEVQQQLKLF